MDNKAQAQLMAMDGILKFLSSKIGTGLIIVLIVILFYFVFHQLFVVIALLCVAGFFGYLAVNQKKPSIPLAGIAAFFVIIAVVGPSIGAFSTFGEEFSDTAISITQRYATDPANPNNYHQFSWVGNFSQAGRAVGSNEDLLFSVTDSYSKCGDDYSRTEVKFTQYIDDAKVGETSCIASCGSSGTQYSGCPILPASLPAASLAGGYHNLKVVASAKYSQPDFGGGVSDLGESTIYSAQFYKEPPECASTQLIDYKVSVPQGVTLRVTPQSANETGFQVANPIFCHSVPVQEIKANYTDVSDAPDATTCKSKGGVWNTAETKCQKYTEVSHTQQFEPLDLLSKDGYVTVPEGELWLVSYRGTPAADVNGLLQCSDAGGVWDSSTNICDLPPTIYYNCHGVITTSKNCVTQDTPNYLGGDPSTVIDLSMDNPVCQKYFDINVTPTPNCPAEAKILFKETTGYYCEWNCDPCPASNPYNKATKKCAPSTTVAPPVNGEIPPVSVGTEVGLPGTQPANDQTNTIIIVVVFLAVLVVAGFFTRGKLKRKK